MEFQYDEKEHHENEVIPAILALFPDATLDSDNDGQVVIYTGCIWGGKYGETITGNMNLDLK